MWKRRRRRSLRITTLLVLCSVAGLVALPCALGYTRADVASRTLVAITDTENALIAVKLSTEAVCFPGNVIRGQIVNNMGVALTSIKITGASIDKDYAPAGAMAIISITAPSSSNQHTGIVQAHWRAGTATIPYSLYIDVIDPSLLSASWDIASQTGIVTNSSAHDLLVSIDGSESFLQSGGRLSFIRSCERARVTFSPAQSSVIAPSNNLDDERAYTIFVETPEPPSPPAVLGVEILPEQVVICRGREEGAQSSPITPDQASTTIGISASNETNAGQHDNSNNSQGETETKPGH